MDYKETEIRTDVRKTYTEGGRPMRSASAPQRPKRKSPTPKIAPPIDGNSPLNQATALINAWEPNLLADRRAWPEIAEAVRSHLLAAKFDEPQAVPRYMRALARHASIRHRAGHKIDDPADLFSNPALAKTFSKEGTPNLSISSRATELSYLRRIRRILLPGFYGPTESLVFGVKQIAPAYGDKELAALLAFTRGRIAPRNIRIHGALLLGLAAGATKVQIPYITGDNVFLTPWGLVVKAPKLPAKDWEAATMLLPVLGDYENELAELARIAKAEPFIGRSHSLEFRDTSRAQTNKPGVPVFNAGRARSTWMVILLKGGASFVAMRQAGVATASDRSLNVLSKGLSLELEEFVTMLRMGEKPFDYAAFSDLPILDLGTL